MNRLRYRSKFMLLGLVVTLVMLLLLVNVMQGLTASIDSARHELDGVQMLKPMNRMVQFIQQHRGLSAGLLGGNESMRAKQEAKRQEVQSALQATDAALSPELRGSAAWQRLRQDWERLASEGLRWSVADNINFHNQLIDQALLVMVDVADATELTLDPAMDTYYIMDSVVIKMPAMLERLGQTRARGTGVLARKEISPAMRVDMAATLVEMTNTLRAQNINLGKVIHHAPTLEAALASARRDFTGDVEKVLLLVREDILSERFATPSQDYFAQTTALIDRGYQTMQDTLIPQLEQQLSLRMDKARQSLIWNISVAAALMLLAFYLSFGIYYSVIDSVEIFSRGAQRMANGDLTAQFVTAGQDELHQAGSDFNSMAGALASLFGRIRTDVQQLRLAAGELVASSQQISTSTGVQSDSASSMAASVEQMTVGVDHIARNAQDAQVFSCQSDEVAAQGGHIVRDVIAEIERIAQTVNHSAAAVAALGRQSTQISAIVGTIKEIAEQTNLLALNAAIEAARAGESGRGFAVVADEVRKLAERTTISTQEIAGMIAAIQSDTETAVSSMQEGVDRVADGVRQAQRAGEAIGQVQEQSRQVVDAVGQITEALREQSAASIEIARNVEKIARMAEQNDAAAGSNANTANRLRQMAESLSSEVDRFKH